MSRSSVETDPAIKAEIDAAIARGATIDQILSHIRGMGSDISRSAVGRYTQRYSKLAKRQRDMQTVAKAFAEDFGQAEDRQGRMMIQLATSLITRSLLPAATGDDDDDEDSQVIDTKSLADIGRAVKDITSAAKIDIERETKIREEAARRARQEAASAAETALKTAGASAETMRNVRMGILGLSA